CDVCGEPVSADIPGPDEEYSLPLEDGKNQITFYFNRAAEDYDSCDIWMWEEGGAEGRGFLLHECDYGAKAVINIDENCARVGFIVRTGCSDPGGTSWGPATKDATQDDRFVSIKERETFVYLKGGDKKAYSSTDGGKTLVEIKSVDMADLRDLNTVRFAVSSASAMSTDPAEVKLLDGEGNEVKITQIQKLSSLQAQIKTEDELALDRAYTLHVADLEPVPVVPITYFSSDDFAEKYHYDGALGVELTATQTIFRLWAPTASSVRLNLFDAGDGGSAQRTVALVRGEKGVWSYTENANLNGKYYTYTVKTSAGEQEAVDPYAVSAGLNGNRGMILDLDSTDPQGWSEELFVPSAAVNGKFNYTDAELWEVHVRDFSNTITDSKLPASYRGKYMAFTKTGLTNSAGIPVGVDYLKELGITHVHLMPSYDYATVDESANTGFNWGYDPKNYNVPEGSYSTDPRNGAVRVNEFKQMVQALHAQGIGVVMDVVYNHTYALDSNFNKIVPYYYYRFQTNGKPSNGSGCGNETASDRYMFGRYMLDSVTYWMKEYGVDGFRFDLMGLHDTDTMKAIEQAVHEINPNALIYGEGWTGGSSTLDSGKQSTLTNIRTVNGAVGGNKNNHVNGIAMFNDVLRDAIKGSTNGKDTGFATGADETLSQAIRFGVNGGVKNTGFGTANNKGSWNTYNPSNLVNYASAHDNLSLWDKICYAYGEEADTLEARLRRNRLSAAIVQTSLGIPFMQAGEEMLRDKKNADGSYNENSYNSSDAVNNLKWERLTETSAEYAMMRYYSGLIAFRKAHETLRLPLASDRGTTVNVLDKTATKGAVIAFTMNNPYDDEVIYVVYNAGETSIDVTLPEGSWDLFINGTTAGTTAIQSGLSGAQQIEAISCYVYVKH
ncbi:MAG: type I pullulanase, partial [Clostridia bacterium]|nr:type I pullulanase [Clostridia bacterium]